MTRIVITSFGSFGDVYPYIGLALELRARGHEPVLATSPFYRETVEREGLAFRPVRPDVDPTDRETLSRIMDPARGTELIVRDLLMASLRESFADLSAAARGADLLVTHPVTFAGPILAARESMPWISTVLAPMSFFSADDLPVFAPMPWVKRLERLPGVARALVRLARSATVKWGEPVHALRAELGLPRGDDPLFEGQHSRRLVLALFSRVLADPQPDWPSHVRISGQIPYDGPGSAALSPEAEAFLEAGPAPVVFTLGSSAVGAAGDFYRVSAQAARRLGVRAVLLTGPHAENRPTPDLLGDDLLVADFLPHGPLFQRAVVVVHQGGAGTLHKGLRSGRPTLVVPHAHDQPDNAHRVERLGVSRTIRPRHYTVSNVTRALRALLEDEAYGRRAEAVAATVRSEHAASDACDAIDAVLE